MSQPAQPDGAPAESTESLALQARRYRRLFDQRLVGVYRSDPARGGKIVACNQAIADMFGFDSPEQMVGVRADAFYRGGTEDREAAMDELRDEGVLVEYDLALRKRDGSPIWVVAHSRLVDDPEEGRVIEGIFIDVTERVRARRALRERERRFRELAEHIEEVFWLSTAEKDEMLYVNRVYEEVWGRSRHGLYEDPGAWLEAIHPEDRQRVEAALPSQAEGTYEEEYRIVRPDGEVRWIRDRAFPIEDDDGEVRRIGGIAEDITERKRAERELEHRALHDQLTGLPNRDLLRDRFGQAIRRSRRRGESFAVAYVDLDEFKPINDEYGHQAGDRVLVEVADRLRDRTRDEDTVSRLGGDEFVVLLERVDGPSAVRRAAERLLGAFEDPVPVPQGEPRLGASIGLVLVGHEDLRPRTEQDVDEVVDELIRRADRAMYEAKEGGGAGYRLTRFSDDGP